MLQVQANYTKGTVLHAYLYASSEGQAALEWQAPLSCSRLRLLWAKVSGFPGYAMVQTPEQREPKRELWHLLPRVANKLQAGWGHQTFVDSKFRQPKDLFPKENNTQV